MQGLPFVWFGGDGRKELLEEMIYATVVALYLYIHAWEKKSELFSYSYDAIWFNIHSVWLYFHNVGLRSVCDATTCSLPIVRAWKSQEGGTLWLDEWYKIREGHLDMLWWASMAYWIDCLHSVCMSLTTDWKLTRITYPLLLLCYCLQLNVLLIGNSQ